MNNHYFERGGSGKSLFSHGFGASSVKYGCFSASAEVMRLLGLSWRSFSSKSRQAGVAMGMKDLRGLVSLIVNYKKLGRASTSGQSSTDGAPLTVKIFPSWSIWLEPGKSVCLKIRLPMMHPAAQMSTAGP